MKRLGLPDPALCPGLLALGRKDDRRVNGGRERARRKNMTRNEERRERKEKMTSGEQRRTRGLAGACVIRV